MGDELQPKKRPPKYPWRRPFQVQVCKSLQHLASGGFIFSGSTSKTTAVWSSKNNQLNLKNNGPDACALTKAGYSLAVCHVWALDWYFC